MIDSFAKAWELNQLSLKEWFEDNDQNEYDTYKKILEVLLEEVVNPYLQEEGERGFDTEKIHEIDDGYYQGTLVFVVPRKIYQPSPWEYITVTVHYGSCSVCDTLLGISGYDDGKPSDMQVRDYMMLALHMLEDAKWLRGKEDGDGFEIQD